MVISWSWTRRKVVRKLGQLTQWIIELNCGEYDAIIRQERAPSIQVTVSHCLEALGNRERVDSL